jgi:transposase InsO family protein
LRSKGIGVATRLVQETVRELKAERSRHERERIEAQRVHVDVLARDALWCADQTHLGRDRRGRIESLVVSDCLGPRTLAASLGPPACGEDMVHLLEHAALERGGWPFVVQFDNGSENANQLVEERLAREQVIILWNQPRTPQHNPRAEHVNGDLKRTMGLCGARTRGADPLRGPVWSLEPGVARTRVAVGVLLREAWVQLDARTPRPALGGLTPLELDSLAPRADDLACRARFYEDVCRELQRIALLPVRARARRKLEREEIWSALVRAGLVKRTRGGLPVPTGKAEGVS